MEMQGFILMEGTEPKALPTFVHRCSTPIINKDINIEREFKVMTFICAKEEF